MCMEHFEVHKERLEDLLVDLDKYGPKILTDIPEGHQALQPVTIDDFALIDELSGLNPFLEDFMHSHNVPETVKDRIRARMVHYSGEKPKEIALMELREKIYGNQRWASNLKIWNPKFSILCVPEGPSRLQAAVVCFPE